MSKFPEPITGIMGPPGAGKTFLAGTLIPEFRAAVAAKKPHVPTVRVNDVVWLQFDRAGSDTLRSYGVEPAIVDFSKPPAYLVDLFAEESSAKVLAAIKEARNTYLRELHKALRAAGKEAIQKNVRLLVVDSATAMTKMITSAYIMGEQIASPSDKFNKQQQYGFANMALEQTFNILRAIPIAQVWLLHVRSTYTGDTAEQLDTQARRPLAHTVELDVQRGVQGALEPVPSMILGAKVSGGNGGKVDYHLITKPDGTYAVKNRWAVHMPNDTVPDLQRIWDIIAAASAEQTK